MSDIISISKLNKSFKTVHAVNDLSLKVREGSLFAFLGINGAGKSVTISLMCGELKPDSGNITIDGLDIRKHLNEIKALLGVVFQDSVLDKALTVRENLQYRASLYDITGRAFEERLETLSEEMGFTDILDREVKKLSGGQRRRADIARALLHRPKILILDEPTTGLDPQTRRSLWNYITKIRSTQKLTVFLTTHYMEEAEDADYAVILQEGRIAAQGTPLELKDRYTGDFITFYDTSEEEMKKLGTDYRPVANNANSFRIQVADTGEATKLITEHPEVFHNYEIIKGRMDDVFLAATGYTKEALK